MINTQQVHLVLTVKLPEIIEKIQNATGPLYFRLSLAGQRPKLELLKDDIIGSRRPSRVRRSR